MKISEFLAEEMTRGAKFLSWWMSQHEEDPEAFPLDMEPGQWNEHLYFFDPEAAEAEERHSLAVIGPDTIHEAMEKAHAGGDHSSLQGGKTMRVQWKNLNRSAPPRANLPSRPYTDKVGAMDREEVIDAQDWDVISVLHHAEMFIELKGLDEDFDEYLRGMARSENEGEPPG